MTSITEIEKERVQDFLIRCLNPGKTLDATLCMQWSDEQVDYFHFMCKEKRIYPIIYNRLKVEPGIPESILSPLHKLYKANALQNVHIFSELKKILSAFNKQNLEPVLLKGCYLAPVIHKNLADRVLRDIDILVDMNELEKSQSILESLGFLQPPDKKMSFSSTQEKSAFFSKYKHLYPFEKNGILIELHTTIVNENDPKIDIQALIRRTIKIRILDHEARIFHPEDFLMHLCVHLAYQDKFTNGLQALYDIALLYNHFKDEISIENLLQTAKQYHCFNGIALTLFLCETVTGLKIKNAYYENLNQEDVIKVSDIALSQMFSGNYTVRYHKVFESGPIEKIRLILSRIFISREELKYRYGAAKTNLDVLTSTLKHIHFITHTHIPRARKLINKKSTLSKTVREQGQLIDWLIKK